MLAIRFAQEKDAEAIVKICSEAWRNTYAHLYSEAYIAKVISEFYAIDRVRQECLTSTKEWHGYMVAEQNGEIVGCIGGACEGTKGLVYVLYLTPNLKRQGIGTALLTFLTDYQKATYDIVTQEVYATTDNTIATSFYEKQGFELLGVEPNWLDDSEGTQHHYVRTV